MSKLTKFALPLIAIGQFAGALFQNAGIVGDPIGERSTLGGIPPELPPGVFFAIIWSVIFTLYAVFAVMAVTSKRHMYDRLALPLVCAGLANIVWMVLSQVFGNTYLDFVMLFPVAAAVWTAAYRLDEMGGFDGTGPRLIAGAVTGLLSGWIAAAISVGGTRAVREFLGQGPSDLVWPFFWTTALFACVCAYIFRSRISTSLWFYIGLGWGIAGIIVNNWTRLDQPLVALMAGLVGIFILMRRLRRGAEGSGGLA